MSSKHLNMTEKYRPIKIEDIVGQEHVKKRMKGYIKNKSMPHIMFSGGPGIGKTASARVLGIGLGLLKPGEEKSPNFAAYNASKNRGIDFVRGEINELCSISPVGAPFKIIFLDEVDEFTKDAQGALREIMMAHTNVTKFILSCNYPNKIIEPIQDRCRRFRFKPVDPKDIETKLISICKNENLEINKEVLTFISEHCKGSVRTAINHLETCIEEGDISIDGLKDDLFYIEDKDIIHILDSLFKGDIKAAEEQLFILTYSGFSGSEFLDNLYRVVGERVKDIDKKKEIIWRIGNCDWRITQGSNEILQLRCLLYEIEDVLR